MTITLGSVQLRIMRVLWDEGEASARRITEVLSESHPIAHSTVQTLLRQLAAKKAVTHEKHERTFVFRPLVAECEVSRSVAHDLLARVFQGSISGLVGHLLDNESLPPDELARLRALVNSKVKETQ